MEIISVRFRSEGKQYFFDPQGLDCQVGDGLVVETANGLEYAECARSNFSIGEAELVAPLRPVLRKADEEDLEVVQRNQEKETYAFRVCQEKILEHGLDMKLVNVECSFEGNKILFFFTSEGRVDFRGLVKSLAAVFHTRIELRQIGIRDEAKMLGGLGICGRPFCCSSFLREFQPVSIKMAKTQSLSLNPTKISGTCGRLMCCLKYEQNAYEDLLKGAPKVESFVETPDGVGTIISVNTLREKVRVRLDDAPDSLKSYPNNEIRVVRSGKGRRPEDYVVPPKAELEKLRKGGSVSPEEADQQQQAQLSAALDQFMVEHQEEKSSGGRRHRGGKGERSTPEEAAPAKEGAAEEKHHRPRHRRRGGGPKPEGSGQQNQPKVQEGEKKPQGEENHPPRRSRGGGKGGGGSNKAAGAQQPPQGKKPQGEGGQEGGEKKSRPNNWRRRNRRRPSGGGTPPPTNQG